MENQNSKVITSKSLRQVTCVATFENHYKAMLFKKGMGEGCVLKPVPRLLSSSCGTAAFFSLQNGQLNLTEELKSLVDAIYRIEGKEGDKDGRFVEIYK